MIPSPKSHVLIRRAAHEDVPRLVDLNHAAYPDLVEENVVWNAAQLHGHLSTFAEGQRVVERDGVIVGALSTFIVSPDRDPLAPHTWIEITADGRFADHDLRGDTLYLADVYTDPASRGTGVGSLLYDALKDLCRSLNLRRVVAGGRLWGYSEFAPRLTPREYVAQVTEGTIRDRVLGSQLRAGFVVRDILPNYLRDGRSGNFATLLEWTNPARAVRDLEPSTSSVAPLPDREES